MKSVDLVYDMFAIGDDQLNNINVNLEKVTSLQLKNTTVKEAVDRLVASIDKYYEN